MAKQFLVCGMVALLTLCGCATTTPVTIDSTPQDATIFSSKENTGPWEVWKKDEGRHVTPSRSKVPVGEYYWVKVSKEDYLDSEPTFFRAEPDQEVKLDFDLEMDPETFAELQREKGLVLYEGKWVDPKAKDLVEHEGKWVDPGAYGLVKYQGRWVDPDASGLIRYQGRWVDPGEEGLINYRGNWVRPEDEGLVYYDGRWMTPLERDDLREAVSGAPAETQEAVVARAAPEKTEPLGTLAEGLAAIRDNDLAAARQAAIDDALNNALQQHLGLHLKSSRVSENYTLMKYRIESEASGVVDSYEVLEEANDDDLYWVKLRVVFREDMIKSKNLDKTRALVAGDEVFVSDDVLFTSTLALQAITNSFAEAGFRITPNPDASWNLRSDVFDASVFEQYRAQAKSAGADLLVAVNAKSQFADKFGNLITYNTMIEGRVTKAQTGEIVAAKTMNLRGERKLTEPEAAEASLAQAGEAISDYLIDQVINRYSGLLSHTLRVTNVKSRGQADLIARELRTVPGVKSVSLVEYSPHVAQLEVELTPEANESFPEQVNRLRETHLKVIHSLQMDTVARVYR